MVALALRRLAGIALPEVLYADDGQQNETVTVSTLLAKAMCTTHCASLNCFASIAAANL